MRRGKSAWARRVVALAMLAGACALAWRWWTGPPVPEDLAAAIDAIVEEAMAEGPIAGVTVGVARGGWVIHAKGYGYADLDHRVPATAETVYRVGSLTKQFTAAAVMDLADEGLLTLDTRVADIVDFPPHGRRIDVRSLLTHTSGLTDYTGLQPWWTEIATEVTPASLVEFFRQEPLIFEPGSRFSYSNSGYALLGYLVEQVTGRPYGGILNELIAPAGLSATRYCDDRAIVPHRARGYQVRDGAFVNAPYMSQSHAYAAGAICSTVTDLIRWTLALARGGVVPRASYEQMIRPGTLSDGTSFEYGYGLALGYLHGRHRITHVGGTLGFASQMAHYDEDDLVVVVLTNTEGAEAATIETAIARLLLDQEAPPVRDLPLERDELERYAGTYDLGLTHVTVLADGERLRAVVTTPGLEADHVLLYQGDDVFQAAGDPEIVAHFEAVAGRGGSVTLTHRSITMRGKRLP